MGKPCLVTRDNFERKLEERTLGSETSQYQEEKKKNIYFLSSGERKGRSPNRSRKRAGL